MFSTPDFDASAAFFQVFSLPGAFQFSLMRKGWYICRSINKNYHRTEIVTDYNMASSEWLRRCSFALRPLASHENPLMNCFDTISPTKPPRIPGIGSTNTTPPHTNRTTARTTRPTTVPTTPHKDDGKKSLIIIIITNPAAKTLAKICVSRTPLLPIGTRLHLEDFLAHSDCSLASV